MRPFFALVTLYVGVSGVLAQSQNVTFITEEAAKIPACGLTCLKQTIPQVGCSFVNTTCQCLSSDLVAITANCMIANCTVADSIVLSKIQAAICERPHESRNPQIKTITIVAGIFSNTSILLRFLSRYFVTKKIALDDWFILAAFCADVNFTNFGVQLYLHGLGHHIWMLDTNDLQQILFFFYICEIIYLLNIAFIKTSILFFYLQVFPKRSFRIQCWIVMAFCLATGISFTFVSIFQCYPISSAWDRDLKGKCINYNTSTWVNAAFNILQDILIVILPVYELRILHLSTRKKIGVYAMFGLGLIVCILSIIRLWSLNSFGLTADPTWDNVPTFLWSTFETTTAIVCACMPSIRAGFVRVYPKVWGSLVENSTTPSPTISMGCIPYTQSDPSRKSWPAQELGSRSTLIVTDEEVHRPGTNEIVIARSSFKHEPTLTPGQAL